MVAWAMFDLVTWVLELLSNSWFMVLELFLKLLAKGTTKLGDEVIEIVLAGN
jgi:hypothetical protein